MKIVLAVNHTLCKSDGVMKLAQHHETESRTSTASPGAEKCAVQKSSEALAAVGVQNAERFFEEFLICDGDKYPKCLGVLDLESNSDNRVLGYYGKREFAITEPITLRKGHREVTYRASVKRPLLVRTMLQRLEGRRD